MYVSTNSLTRRMKVRPDQNKRKTRKRALDKLAKKLCHCIKAVGGPYAYPICQCSVAHSRGLQVHRFTCKGKPRILRSSARKQVSGLTVSNKTCPALVQKNQQIKQMLSKHVSDSTDI